MGTLEEKGTPAMVQRVLIAPPQSRIGPLSEQERTTLIRQSALAGRYDQVFDRESAYELLARKASRPEVAAHEEKGLGDMAGEFLGGVAGQALKSAMRQAVSQIGRELVRGLMGSLLGSKRRR